MTDPFTDPRPASRWRKPLTLATVFATGAAFGLVMARPFGSSTVVAPAAPVPGANPSAAPTTGAPPLTDGADPNSSVLSGGAQWWIWSPGPGELGANPQAFSFDQVVNGRSEKRVG